MTFDIVCFFFYSQWNLNQKFNGKKRTRKYLSRKYFLFFVCALIQLKSDKKRQWQNDFTCGKYFFFVCVERWLWSMITVQLLFKYELNPPWIEPKVIPRPWIKDLKIVFFFAENLSLTQKASTRVKYWNWIESGYIEISLENG